MAAVILSRSSRSILARMRRARTSVKVWVLCESVLWFGIVYTIISQLFTVLNIPWTVLYLIVSIIIIYYLHKAKTELLAPVATPTPPAQMS